MKKKITLTIDVEDLRSGGDKERLINLRVDEKLYKGFKNLCEKELGQSMSDVIRKLMKELCKNLAQ